MREIMVQPNKDIGKAFEMADFISKPVFISLSMIAPPKKLLVLNVIWGARK